MGTFCSEGPGTGELDDPVPTPRRRPTHDNDDSTQTGVDHLSLLGLVRRPVAESGDVCPPEPPGEVRSTSHNN